MSNIRCYIDQMFGNENLILCMKYIAYDHVLSNLLRVNKSYAWTFDVLHGNAMFQNLNFMNIRTIMLTLMF